MELVARGDRRYRDIWEAIENLDSKKECAFGEQIRRNLFGNLGYNATNAEYWFTNHGSFGAVPKPVMDAHCLLLTRVEEHPDSWYRRDVKPLYFAACDAAAKFVGASNEEVVLVDNATTAVNTVLRSLRLEKKDGVMVTSFSYAACSIAARAECQSTGAQLHVMQIHLPITRESIVQMYREYLDQHPGVKFALVDHITSPAAVAMPVKEIVRVCRERGVMVMVDAAHAPGQLPLDVKDIGAQFLTGNFHKWVFCSRGSALLYVEEGLQSSIYPLVASHGYFSTDFRERFLSQATRDMVSFCVTPTAISFFNKIGGLEAVEQYNTSLLSWGVDMLCQHLSLSPLPVPPDMKAPFMSLLVLPPSLGPPTTENEQRLMDKIFTEYNVQTVICLVDGRLCCRISAQVYNIRQDYEKLAEALETEIQLTK